MNRKYLFIALCCVVVASGCGSDGSVGLASGQEPDPVAVDFPISYTKRSVPLDEDGNMMQPDLRDLDVFEPGAALFIRDRASPSSPERQVTPEAGDPDWDIRDLQVSYDGTKIVFAMRGPFLPDVEDDEQPTWDIWEYDIATDMLRRVIPSDLAAAAGHDRMPLYLPDGRIVFTSTRQRRTAAILVDEGRPQYAAQTEDNRGDAFVLHVMEADGSNIQQISFNTSHDLYPAVLPDGTLAYTRWENTRGRIGMHLYRMRPDGTDTRLLYGANSHDSGSDGDTVQFVRTRPLPDGTLLSLLQPFEPAQAGGDLVALDTSDFLEVQQAVVESIKPGPGQAPVTVNNVRTDDQPSPGGRFTAGWPLWDGSGRLLVNWSQCRLLEQDGSIQPCTEEQLAAPGATAADPLYGLWLYDPASETQLPVVVPDEGEMIDEAIAARPRTAPPVLFDDTGPGGFEASLAQQGLGVIDIRSVWEITGEDITGAGIATLADPAQRTADQRSRRFLRVVRLVPQPDRDVRRVPGTAFGAAGRFIGMREIVGYVPVEPDGSVRMTVPADMPLGLEVLDRNGRRNNWPHRNWLQVRPGETLSCNGCHVANTGMSHGRAEAFSSVWEGAPETGLPFPNTDPAMTAIYGETMAQLRSRISCETDCAAQTPSLDLVYDDVWTDEDTAGRAPDDPFAWRYADLQTEAPVTAACLSTWAPQCRAIIHYEQHIHPLWSLDRRVFDTDGITVLADNTCTSCHTPRDADDEPQVPAAQLDLTDGQSPDQADHFKAFRELLFDDLEQEVVDGALVDRLVEVGIDPDTMEPILVTVPVARSMRGGWASGSDFFDVFAADASHAGFLSEAELKLLSEWVDIGGQYYNDPFVAPEN
ncbi:MAG: PD40 domain-containing protein [Gammaproteobacteria bacterium]|nr:PD40 domain-containing protein [Gammaproteobacteria bacterium]NNF61786.1 hypothetical protein [Gammaproteobacteria bacterium]NNM20453.1 hypothetical protein [Gammaproteobacteria bacterium]